MPRQGAIDFRMFKPLALYGFLALILPDHGPSPQMFHDLQTAQSEEAAGKIANDIWDSWLESGSDTADLIMQRAIAAQAGRDLDQARALYDHVIAIQPDYAEVWARRASLFLSQQNYNAALRDVNEALRLEPRHFGAWAGLGSVLENLGAEDAALIAYQRAIEIYPLYTSAKQGIARLRQAREGRPV